ncbi:porin family protein [Maribacter sp. PR1]|uniref:Porin family protein n=1 Tax=Maribacter cobaltidurans TaxID=1178778 RepID=A0ABU7IYL7_9FLAO|nr:MULTISPECIES: porin family protein [Maribacter]MDC6390221.1 porin family protein [Maribacter sp. PR1]MEE1977611.1 porin family protein [Maribacter cobaltidurans]
MKKWLFICFGVLTLNPALHAQFNENPVLNKENEDKKFLNWGYFLGFNQYDFKFDYIDDLPGPLDDVLIDKTIGFNVGLIGEMRLNNHMDIRLEPGLHYTSRNLGFTKIPQNEQVSANAIREVKSTYINFPLLLKISTKRLGNWKPFLIGGGSMSLNLGSNEASLDDNRTGTFRMTKWVYNYELGFGIDFYLEYFKFSPSIRGVFALTDELIRDNDPNSPWTGNIDSMKTRGIFINFTFE